LLNVSGRKVLDIHPGANDVRALAASVYLVREGGVRRAGRSRNAEGRADEVAGDRDGGSRRQEGSPDR
jgi:hypothetical protein